MCQEYVAADLVKGGALAGPGRLLLLGVLLAWLDQGKLRKPGFEPGWTGEFVFTSGVDACTNAFEDAP